MLSRTQRAQGEDHRNAGTGRCSTQLRNDDELSGAHFDRIAFGRKAQRCFRAAKAWIIHRGS
jgi:hypothetical protein